MVRCECEPVLRAAILRDLLPAAPRGAHSVRISTARYPRCHPASGFFLLMCSVARTLVLEVYTESKSRSTHTPGDELLRRARWWPAVPLAPAVAAAVQGADGAVQVGAPVPEHSPPAGQPQGQVSGSKGCIKMPARACAAGQGAAAARGRPGAHPARLARHSSRSKVAVTKPSSCLGSGSMPPLAWAPRAPACGPSRNRGRRRRRERTRGAAGGAHNMRVRLLQARCPGRCRGDIVAVQA